MPFYLVFYCSIRLYLSSSGLKVLTFTDLEGKDCRKHCGKGENASKKHFFPIYSKCFLPYQEQILSLESLLICRLQLLSIWTSLTYCCLVMVVLGFNATLTAKVISWRSVMHMCFLAFSHQY